MEMTAYYGRKLRNLLWIYSLSGNYRVASNNNEFFHKIKDKRIKSRCFEITNR